MELHGALADPQLLGDRGVPATSNDELQDFALSPGQSPAIGGSLNACGAPLHLGSTTQDHERVRRDSLASEGYPFDPVARVGGAERVERVGAIEP